MNNECESNDFLKIKNVIVTGATGFVGSHVVKSLIKKNYIVTVLARNIEKTKKIEFLSSLKVINFDIQNPNQKIELPLDATLIHCAWEDVNNSLKMSHIERHFLNNYLFLKNIITLGVKKIIVTGTCYEYGLQYGAVSAMSDTKPNTPYALAKDNLHKSLRMLQNEVDFHLIWARLFYMYGDGQDEKSIIPLFDKALEINDSIFNMSLGEQLFDYLPVEKVADHLTTLVNYKNGIFNISKGEPISLRRIHEKRMKEKGKDIKLNLGYYNYRKQDSLAIWGDKSFEIQLNDLIGNEGKR